MSTIQQQEISRIVVAHRGLIRRRDHPDLVRSIDYLVRIGRLQRVLPGVYAPPDIADRFDTRVAAAPMWSADAVLLRQAAARLTFWPELDTDLIEVSAPSRRLAQAHWLVGRRRVTPDLLIERSDLGPLPVRVTAPAVTAVDLIDALGGDPVDRVLRSRQARLGDLWEAHAALPHRRGNRSRRRILIESRAAPWSAAERILHRLLREAGIGGWSGNVAVWIGGNRYFPDVAFRGPRLAIEVDGTVHAHDLDVFRQDRRRQNALVLAGWTVLRFTWEDLTGYPTAVIAQIRAALRKLRRRTGTSFPSTA